MSAGGARSPGVSVRVSHSVRVPDPIRVERCRRAPELGPSLVFFSGGSALRGLSRVLKRHTHNSVHIITPFDSGGSSARLREAFGMLSIGDLRNRIVALADETVRGNPPVYALFSHRFPSDAPRAELLERLRRLASGDDPLIAAVPAPLRRIARTHLGLFIEAMPDDFDLRVASIGNLMLTAGYLTNDRDIDSVIFLFSRLVAARGLVTPVVDADLHLAAELADGRTIVGQHRLTGRRGAAITSPIARLSLVRGPDEPEPATVAIDDKVRRLIETADLLCFPMGSFYTSVVANLLPEGVGRAVAAAPCPKVFVPNLGDDPEMLGLTPAGAVDVLLETLRRDAGADTPTERLLDLVLVDRENGAYQGAVDLGALRARGVEPVDLPLAAPSKRGRRADPLKLAEALLSLA